MKNILSYNDFLKEDAGDGGGGCAMGTAGSGDGMGPITSASPSSIPGAVWASDSKSGSGDVSANLGTYFKPMVHQKRRKKRRKN